MAGDMVECPSNGATNTRRYEVVVAATQDMGIGKDGKMPWSLPGDLKYFKEITTYTLDPSKKNAVVMGRKTWESIPTRFRPLPGRLNVVLTRSGISNNSASHDNVVSCGSMTSALNMLSELPYGSAIEKIFLIGGGEILREGLNAQECDAVHITEIKTPIECDTFIPAIDMFVYQPWYSSSPIVENGIRYCFVTYVRTREGPVDSSDESGESHSKRPKILDFTFLPKLILEKHEEFMYLRLVQDIISNGISKDDRTGTGTLSKFGCQMRFNLRKSFPLLTTKRVFWRGVVKSFCGS